MLQPEQNINKRDFLNGLRAARLTWFIGLVSMWVLLLATPAISAPAQPKPATPRAEVDKIEKALGALEDPNYFYKREGRIDPFMPFVSEETVKAEQEKEEVLTGMRRFEPGQLTLVAIIISGKEPVAMVEDSVGKGYTLRIGTEIGRRGVVENIVPNKVVIKEKITSAVSEQVRYKTIEMILRKEGEKK